MSACTHPKLKNGCVKTLNGARISKFLGSMFINGFMHMLDLY
jgi:hypothetical protein